MIGSYYENIIVLLPEISLLMSYTSEIILKGMVQQGDPSFAPELGPTSPLLSPQNPTSQSPLLQQTQPPPGYQSPDMKNWQGGVTNR